MFLFFFLGMCGLFAWLCKDSSCSGRSIAILLVAWVGTAIVTSVVLKWEYMWITLAILTTLFLFACGYAMFSNKKFASNNEDVNSTADSRRRTREREIQTVSGSVETYNEVYDAPPAYQPYWITDLPPTYCSVMESQASTLSTPRRNLGDLEPPQEIPVPRLSNNPPPYSIAIGLSAESGSPDSGNETFSRLENSVPRIADPNRPAEPVDDK